MLPLVSFAAAGFLENSLLIRRADAPAGIEPAARGLETAALSTDYGARSR